MLAQINKNFTKHSITSRLIERLSFKPEGESKSVTITTEKKSKAFRKLVEVNVLFSTD